MHENVFESGSDEDVQCLGQVCGIVAKSLDGLTVLWADADGDHGADRAAERGGVDRRMDAGDDAAVAQGTHPFQCGRRSYAEQVRQVAKRLPNGGNVLYVRGLAGTSIDADITTGVQAEIQKHPNLKIVSEVNGNWDQTTAQKTVATALPSLPEIAAVIDQGGDGYGTAQAFKAAGRPLPLIMLGNRQDELAWWKQQKDKDGYTTWSASVAPGLSTLAFWVAQQVLDGRKDIPHDLTVPYLAFDQSNFEAELAQLPDGGVASHEYSLDEAQAAIQANMKK